MKALWFVISALTLTGCGDGAGPIRLGSLGQQGTAEALGTFAGRSLIVRSAIGAQLDYTNGTSEGIILLSDAPNLCTAIESGTEPPNARYLVIDMVHAYQGGFKAPSSAGTLQIVPFSVASTPGDHAVVDFYVSNATCAGQSTPLTEAKTGSLELRSGFGSGTYLAVSTFTTDMGEDDAVNVWASGCSSLAIYNWLNQSLTCQ